MKRIIILLFVICSINLSFAQEEPELKWWSPENSEFPVIAGQAWSNDPQSLYHRLPVRARAKVRKEVWNLSKHSAGLSIQFRTNAPLISVRYKLKRSLAMAHMPTTGVSGMDLYGKSPGGQWFRCWGSYSIKRKSKYDFIIENHSEEYSKNGREFQLFLPLYNEIDSLQIGVDTQFFFQGLPLRKEQPIVAYGTSICQGACATRPGMAWTSILERKLDYPIINLGFSGNGRLEPALIDLMLEIDAKLYILDCLPNLYPDKDDTYQLTLDAVKQIREKKPDVPIILTHHLGFADEWSNLKNKDTYLQLNKELSRAFNHLKSEGVSEIYLLKKEDLGLDFDSFVDSIHPNDLGMLQYANAYEKLIRRIFLSEGSKF